jgi:myosin heavy subunit
VFKGEELIFREEGLGDHIGLIEFTDNEPIMKIMDANKNPPGIFSSINQACALNKDDIYLVNDIIKNHSKNEYFFTPKFSKDKFGVKHTARPGEYFGPGFIEKNKDELPGNLV